MCTRDGEATFQETVLNMLRCSCWRGRRCDVHSSSPTVCALLSRTVSVRNREGETPSHYLSNLISVHSSIYNVLCVGDQTEENA